MVVKLHGFVYSTNTQRVFLVLKELNIPFEYVVVDLKKGEHKSAEYLAKHPFGVVPFMVRSQLDMDVIFFTMRFSG
jgi:glutathione S-transferase